MATTEAAAEAPAETPKDYKRIQYAVLGREGLQFKLGPGKHRGKYLSDEPDTRFAKGSIENVKDYEYAPVDGSKLVLLQSGSFSIYDTDSGELVRTIERPGVQRLAVSPLGTFVLTWEKHAGGPEGNLILWRVSNGEIVFRAVEKNLLATTWPTVQFTADESVAAHMTTNTIAIFKDGDFSAAADKIRDEGLTQFSLMKTEGAPSTENPCKIATFKPELKGGPAKVSVFNWPGSETPVGSKTFFKAQEANFKWSPTGNAVLVKTDTDVDTTGQSYYGESALYLLHANGGYDCKILPAKEGSFHDFAWAPTGDHFVAISGKSPAASILYDIKGETVFDFGQAHRNTIRWSPHGRFLCLGGFGNLSGDMDFWDINKKTKMGSVRADAAVTQEWSPCGRFFMTSTLFPRMRVDNGMTFFTYRGQQLCQVPVREASKALWRPALPGIYVDRPPTPLKVLRKEAKRAAEEAGSGSGPAPITPAGPPKPAPVRQAYRPPGSTGGLSAMMNKNRAGAPAPRTLAALESSFSGLGSAGRTSVPGSNPAPSANPVPGNYVPGAAPPPGADQKMSKSAARRARKKKAAATE